VSDKSRPEKKPRRELASAAGTSGGTRPSDKTIAVPGNPVIRELIIDSDELVGAGGFLKLRRVRIRNRRRDGTVSSQYVCDTVVRPYGQDAVVVVVWARTSRGLEILLRDGLRPMLALARDSGRAPLPEQSYDVFFTELVAGIIEEQDKGEAGLRKRAAEEVAEEAGFAVTPESITLLGAGLLPSPGTLVEKFYFTAVEVDPSTQQPLPGDGSPMEEGARTRWLPLNDALAACRSGSLTDLKTELALVRLKDHLASAESR
jgi:ADP-ribose pyrophosphatase